MRLTVKLYAGLEKYLPKNAENNSTVMAIADHATVNDIVRLRQVPPDQAHLVLLNGTFVNPTQRDDPDLFTEGDTLAIWPPVAGG